MTAERGARGRRVGVVAVLVLACGVAAGILIAEFALRPPRQADPAGTATGTAQVVRTTIVNTIAVSGSLSYAGTYSIVNEAAGTAYTALPSAGAIVRRGQELYEVDDTPVTLFYGARPQWRALSEGVTPGPDVAQLDRNLIALGYGAGLSVSEYYTWATAYAVELWQQAAGLPATGAVPLGQIAFAPGPLRITSVSPALGSPPQPGSPVLSATSPVPVVMAQLPVTQEYLVRRGDQVTVTLPDGVSTDPGIVTAVSPVATAAGGGGDAPDAGASAGPPGSGGSGDGQDTVAMTVRLIRPAAAGDLDQAPVSVGIVAARARGVFAVPVSALVALAEGGYAVNVVHGSGAHAATTAGTAFTGLFLALGALAAGIGGIGIANIMVISVLERRTEIGLRRALGAARRHVGAQFLVESLLLSAFGGLAGVLLGAAATAAYAVAAGQPAVVPMAAVAAGLGIAIGTGVIAGAYPAAKATRLAPAEALRAA